MKIGMTVTGEKTNYFFAPKNIIDPSTRMFCFLIHTVTPFIMSIIIGVKILPEVWPDYAKEFDKNEQSITPIVLFILILVSILIGMIIEKILEATNWRYSRFKKQLKDDEFL